MVPSSVWRPEGDGFKFVAGQVNGQLIRDLDLWLALTGVTLKDIADLGNPKDLVGIDDNIGMIYRKEITR